MEAQKFNFRSPTKPMTFQLSETGGYLNAPACKMLLGRGEYVEFQLDTKSQAIQVVSHSEGGIGRYKLYGASGSPMQVRGKLSNVGMKYGTYIYLGDSVFQHIDHVNSQS